MTNKDPDKKIEAVDKSREKFAGAYAVLAGKDPDKMSGRELRVEVKALRAEIERLRERLEMWPVDPVTGEFNKSADMLDESCDGIACRDETIRLADRQVWMYRKRLGEAVRKKLKARCWNEQRTED